MIAQFISFYKLGVTEWYQSRLSRFHATYGQKCTGMSTGAWSQMPLACGRARVGADARASRMRRHWTHGRGTGTVGVRIDGPRGGELGLFQIYTLAEFNTQLD